MSYRTDSYMVYFKTKDLVRYSINFMKNKFQMAYKKEDRGSQNVEYYDEDEFIKDFDY